MDTALVELVPTGVRAMEGSAEYTLGYLDEPPPPGSLKDGGAASSTSTTSCSPGTLMNYEQIVEENNSLRCTFSGCGKLFKSRWSLTRHLRVHSGERPFKCELCKKSFVQKCSLTRHAQTHSENKLWPCPHPGCDKNFKLKEYLEIHKGIHVRAKPVKELDDNAEMQSMEIRNSMQDQFRERLIRLSMRHRRDMIESSKREDKLRNELWTYQKSFANAMTVLQTKCPHNVTVEMADLAQKAIEQALKPIA